VRSRIAACQQSDGDVGSHRCVDVLVSVWQTVRPVVAAGDGGGVACPAYAVRPCLISTSSPHRLHLISISSPSDLHISLPLCQDEAICLNSLLQWKIKML